MTLLVRAGSVGIAGLFVLAVSAQQEINVSDTAKLRAAAGSAVIVRGTVARVEKQSTGGASSYLKIHFVESKEVYVYVVPAFVEDVQFIFGKEGLVGRKVAVSLKRLYVSATGPIELRLSSPHDIKPGGAPEPVADPTSREPPLFSRALLARLEPLARKATDKDWLGTGAYVDGGYRLYITSGRILALRNLAQGKPVQGLRDAVIVSCGHDDSRSSVVFECVRLRVSQGDREVTPWRVDSTPERYTNRNGVQTQRRRVSAVFAAQELRNGFTVTYVASDGTEAVVAVSAARANERLLLALENGLSGRQRVLSRATLAKAD